mmetsp:Transcript_118324/g.381967  ORF Transcript_118324/g.381967 Transcript_118324/m.381967 type:complete len:208 (+) Transcript_118324:303-926(+)
MKNAPRKDRFRLVRPSSRLASSGSCMRRLTSCSAGPRARTRPRASPPLMARFSCRRSVRPKSLTCHIASRSMDETMKSAEPTPKLKLSKAAAALLSAMVRPGKGAMKKKIPPIVSAIAAHHTGSAGLAPPRKIRLWTISQKPPSVKPAPPRRFGTVTQSNLERTWRSGYRAASTPTLKITAPKRKLRAPTTELRFTRLASSAQFGKR